MPQIYRSMREEDGKPILGRVRDTLGVIPGKDITPQPDGTVQPNTGGMSVSPALGAMLDFLIPIRLAAVIVEAEGATGKNSLRIWKRGTGVFENAPLTANLALRLTSLTHGQVEPNAAMPFDEYEAALQNTRDDWEIDEGGTPL